MGERSGVGLVECEILETLDSLGARPGRGYRKSATLLDAVQDRIGLAPGYAYEMLLDLARPWMMPVSLVRVQGNYGSRGNDPPASPRYTEARLTRAGQAALAAERGDLAPVPVGLINGNTYRDGTRPPFRPEAIIEAVRQVIRRPRTPGKDLTRIVGPPCFLNGCTVTGDLDALNAGRPTALKLQARVTISSDRRSVLIGNFPPNANPDQTVQALAAQAGMRDWAETYPDLHRHARLPVKDIRDESTDARGDLIVCVPEPGVTPEQLRDRLLGIYGIYTTIPVAALPRPLPVMIRNWASAHATEDLLTSLAALEDAIRAQRAGR
ncbi:MAG: hypothetical protein J2P35_03015 [Actinobacteria bacterium]|nr:hypothetical protein [Actinomycetota bacterium]MBO0785364.1 hypothetical protein [Actinomycetota bacterium]MBO0813900.1 hypothetical protein [Actinomycetota bacterium]